MEIALLNLPFDNNYGGNIVDVLLEKHNKDIRKIIDANALAFYEIYSTHI